MPLFISLKVALIATLVTVAFGLPIAYAMTGYRGRAKWGIEALITLPLVLPPTVIGFVLLWLFGTHGPFNSLPIDIVFTWWAAVITATVVAFPLMYRSAQAAFEQIDRQLPEVARTLGASEWRVFRQVVLPLAQPGIVSGVLLSFARALGEFGATLMLAGNIPGKTQTLPMAVYFAVEGGDLATATLWSGVMGAIALFTIILSDFVKRRTLVKQRTTEDRQAREFLITDKTAEYATATFNPRQISNKQTESTTNPTFDSPALTVDITKQLAGFTLRVQFSARAHLVGILGASGAGKSMLLRCLAGVEKPDAGRIVLGDRILYDSEKAIDIPSSDRPIALLFQNYALFPHLTVAENVAFGIQNKQNRQQLVSQELAAVQLSEYASAYPYQLSGGQQQRVALARALICRPQLLLLDEPFSALDTYLRSHLSQQLFARLSTFSGTTLLVSHNLTEAYRSEQLLILHKGKAIRHAPPTDIFEQPERTIIAQLTGPINQSPIQQDGPYLWASAWQMRLQISSLKSNLLAETLPSTNGYAAGIRPQHVLFITPSQYQSPHFISRAAVKMATLQPMSNPDGPVNQAKCWPSNHCLHPESVMLWLKLHEPVVHANDYHLQATVDKATWKTLKQQPLPWTLYLPPQHVIVLRP